MFLICHFGTAKICPSTSFAISIDANVCSSSHIFMFGISPFIILQNTQSINYLLSFIEHYSLILVINTTVSTWLDCSRLMSDYCGRSREFIKAYFCLKTHRFLPLYVLGNRSKTLLLPIICKPTDLPTASRPRSDGTCRKSHRLNLNSSHDRICTFFRFRMDMDHYVLSSSASLLFPEP